MKTTSEQRRAYTGPIFFSRGFRPFFFAAGLWAALAMVIWVLVMVAGMALPSRMSAVDWHLHEFVFGYTSAVIAGFLLTAVPNWTGRMPVLGWKLAGLAALWLAGRVVVLFSAYLPVLLAPLVGISFIAVLALVIGREIVAGKNWRNLKVLIILLLLGLANAVFYIEAYLGAGFDGYGIRAGVALIMLLIMVVGGRIIPSFTRNWLVRQRPGRLPVAFNGFDRLVMVVSAAALLLWVFWPEPVVVRPLAGLAALLNFARLARWAGWRTAAEPLLAILHIGYFFIPYGFLTVALGTWLPGIARAGQIPHAWSAGAIGLVTLAMLTRTSLGQTGRPLRATAAITAIYLAVFLAVVLRILGEFRPDLPVFLQAAGLFWILGFAGFVLYYTPIFFRPRSKPL